MPGRLDLAQGPRQEERVELAEEDKTERGTLGDQPVVQGEIPEGAIAGQPGSAETLRVPQTEKPDQEGKTKGDERPEEEDDTDDLDLPAQTRTLGVKEIDGDPVARGNGHDGSLEGGYGWGNGSILREGRG